MKEDSSIQLIRRDNLDVTKWNACIEQAPNGLIYSYSYYLDLVSPGWEALVMDDYKTVMPLPARKKFGVHYLYQPFLFAQGGITGENTAADSTDRFLSQIPATYRFIDICLNHANRITAGKGKSFFRNNFILNLSDKYETIVSRYADNIRRNLKKSGETPYQFSDAVNPDDVIRLAAAQMQKTTAEYRKNMDLFSKLYEELHQRDMAKSYGVLAADGSLHASCIFFFSHNRAYYILVGNDPAGKLTGASHTLIDAFIRHQSGKNLLLDFEGSDIPGLARYYSGFGAINQPYPAWQSNRLPFFLKWLKKI